MSTIYRGLSIDASYQVTIHLAKRFQRRFFKKITDEQRQTDRWTPSDGNNSHGLLAGWAHKGVDRVISHWTVRCWTYKVHKVPVIQDCQYRTWNWILLLYNSGRENFVFFSGISFCEIGSLIANLIVITRFSFGMALWNNLFQLIIW
jgi:hypothetical protein